MRFEFVRKQHLHLSRFCVPLLVQGRPWHFSSSLDVEWSQMYGLEGGASQVFDMLVDNDGNYLMGGHTTVGPGVINWDYLALKVNSKTKQVEWRNVYGQPRGFNAR